MRPAPTLGVLTTRVEADGSGGGRTSSEQGPLPSSVVQGRASCPRRERSYITQICQESRRLTGGSEGVRRRVSLTPRGPANPVQAGGTHGPPDQRNRESGGARGACTTRSRDRGKDRGIQRSFEPEESLRTGPTAETLTRVKGGRGRELDEGRTHRQGRLRYVLCGASARTPGHRKRRYDNRVSPVLVRRLGRGSSSAGVGLCHRVRGAEDTTLGTVGT